MENGATKQTIAIDKLVANIRHTLCAEFEVERPRLNTGGGWWIVPITRKPYTAGRTLEGLLRDQPWFLDSINEWSERSTDGRVMVDSLSLWFKREEDAVLFWMTFA